MVVVELGSQLPPELRPHIDELGFKTCQQKPDQGEYLFFEDNLLQYATAGTKEKPFFVDIESELHKLARQQRGAKKDLLCRAVGLDKHPERKIIDGTMGLAKDSSHLLHFGAQIEACERDPVVFLLVADARRRLSQEQIVNNFKIMPGKVEELLRSSVLAGEVLYLDPMFAETHKKSLPKKGMVFLRNRQKSLETDYKQLQEAAFAQGIKRIVVKRALRGEHLLSVPDYELKGNLIRYDIYTNKDVF